MNTYFRLSAAVAIVLGLFAAGPAARAGAASPADKPIHAQAVQVFSHDVFVNSGGVLIPADPATTPADTPLFNISGTPLNRTWGQWSSATADSTMRRQRGHTEIKIKLTGLVPHGVYSIFYLTFTPDTTNSLCPNVERLVALTSADPGQQPDASSFVANRKGKATFRALAANSLVDALMVEFVVIYHADGQSYGLLPNRGESLTQGPDCRSSFGSDALRQLVILQQGF